MTIPVVAGSTSMSIDVFLEDSSSTTGAGLTGLVYNTAGLTCYYRKSTSSPVAVTLATQTVTGAYSSGGFVEVDATNMPGVYRFDIPNAAISTLNTTTIYFKGATNLKQTPIRISTLNQPANVQLIASAAPTMTSGNLNANLVLAAGQTVAVSPSGTVTFVGSQSVAYTGAQVDLVNAPNSTAVTAIATAARDISNASPAANSVGDIINIINARASDTFDAVDAITTTINETQSDVEGIATTATTINNKLGAWTGSGTNTVLGGIKAALRADATLPSDIGGTYEPTTDSLEAQAAAGGGNVTVDEFTQDALDQLASIDIEIFSHVVETDANGNPLRLTIVQGADYLNADGTAITCNLNGTFPDWTSGTATLVIAVADVEVSVTGTITDATGSTRSARFDVTRTQSATLYDSTVDDVDIDVGVFDLKVTLANGDVTYPVNRGQVVSRRRA